MKNEERRTKEHQKTVQEPMSSTNAMIVQLVDTSHFKNSLQRFLLVLKRPQRPSDDSRLDGHTRNSASLPDRVIELGTTLTGLLSHKCRVLGIQSLFEDPGIIQETTERSSCEGIELPCCYTKLDPRCIRQLNESHLCHVTQRPWRQLPNSQLHPILPVRASISMALDP